MPRYIALLRAINVGGRTVKMQRLRQLFEELGLSNVATFIASGNVIFETPARNARPLEQRIERHLHESLGYEVATFLRSPVELEAVAAYEAFPGATADPTVHAQYVAFLPAPPNADAERRLLGHRSALHDFRIRGREIYWLSRAPVSDSTFSGAALERAVGMPATVRNVTTVRKLAARGAA